MIEILKGYPDDVLALSGTGHITAADYETVLVPEANARFARHGAVNVLYILGPGYESFSPGAAWSDAKFGFLHLSKFGRLAVVTDVGWIKDAVLMFAPLIRHPVRCFANAELAAARDWIVGKEAGA